MTVQMGYAGPEAPTNDCLSIIRGVTSGITMAVGRIVLVCLGIVLSLALHSSARGQGPLFELFANEPGIRLAVRIDLLETQVSSEDARAYCLERLAELGVPVVESEPDPPGEIQTPQLTISMVGRTREVSPNVPPSEDEPYWYEVNYYVEYWDKVILKRDPSVERYMPLVFNLGTATFFSHDDYVQMATSWRGVRGALNQSLERFQRALEGDWQFGSPMHRSPADPQ